MTMPPSEKVLFEEALKRESPEERRRYLERSCGGDCQRLDRVLALLAAYEVAGDFLENAAGPRPQDLQEWSEKSDSSEAPGARIGGRYRLLQSIGEGGFGTVWMAEQEEPVRRRVAIKIVKLGMDTRDVVARFEHERQALAMMDHPGIARVFDAGSTDSGRPFFVMELVRGQSITVFCDDAELSVESRLRLFVEVCRAVQHAHQKGVIHRDLKPSNILVAGGEDGEPQPKIIDFGVAKAVEEPLTEKTFFTRFEQMIGTPAYMSPEQAGAGPLDVDTRSDIYALGVLLYEMLAGVTPFPPRELLSAGFEEMRRIIRETDPPKPSTRISSLAPDERTRLAAQRRTGAPQLVAAMGGDLDWIVMRALDKNRNRRYQNATDLAADVQRHLAGRPVEARPPTWGYRAAKFVRRHRVWVVGVAAVCAALALGAAAAGVQYRARTREWKRAEAEAAASLQKSRFLEGMLSGVEPSIAQGRDVGVLREILDKAVVRLGADLAGQPAAETDLRLTIARAYLAIGRLDEAEREYGTAKELLDRTPGGDPAAGWRAIELLGHLRAAQGRFAEAEQCFRDVVHARGVLLGVRHRETLRAAGNLARFLMREGSELGEAERILRSSVEDSRAELGERDPVTLSLMSDLSGLLVQSGRASDAQPVARRVLEVQTETLGADHPAALLALQDMARVERDLGNYAEAERLAREMIDRTTKVFGAAHPESLRAMNGLVALWGVKGGHAAEAEAVCRLVYDGLRAAVGPEHPETLEAMNNLADVERELGNLEASLTLWEQLLRILKSVRGNEHPETLRAINGMALVLDELNRGVDAEALLADALEVEERVLGGSHPDTLETMHNLAWMRKEMGRTGDAEQLLRLCIARKDETFGPRHPETLRSVANLVEALALQSRFDDAIRTFHELLARGRGVPGFVDAVRTDGESLARMLTDAGSPGDALDVRRAVDEADQSGSPYPLDDRPLPPEDRNDH